MKQKNLHADRLSLKAKLYQWVEPSADGLPNRRVLFVFPTCLLLLLIALTAFGITGSSTGLLSHFFSDDHDPSLLSGQPQPIRSDEWLVQTPLVISQVEQGLPRDNQTLPGGSDSTVQSDLPSRDWSIAFRPHLTGFLFLPLDNAMALRWWLPALAMIAACYSLIVSISPRRPITAAIVSVAFFFSPFFQWWFLPITFWPVAWSFLVMTSVVWLLRSRSWPGKIGWAALAGYTTVTTAVGIYVPFIVPALLISVAFTVGSFFTRSKDDHLFLYRSRLRALLPLLIAGITGVAVLFIWAVTRYETIKRLLGTVYPGQRLSPTGELGERSVVSLLAGPFTRNLGVPTNAPLDANASEASTFFFVGLFLFIPLIWMAWRRWKANRTVDWLLVSLTVFFVLVVAYMVVPGWDALAHLMLLDRSPASRMKPALGILSVVLIASWAARSDKTGRSAAASPQWVSGLPSLLAVADVSAVAFALFNIHSPLVSASWTWIPLALFFVLSVFLFSRGNILAGSTSLLLLSIGVASGVNPIYVGVYDLNRTAVVKYMKSLDPSHDSEWVGVGNGFLPRTILTQSGLRAYDGLQSAPSPELWRQIDPTKAYEAVWNRLANISWVPGTGNPAPRNPQPDAIVMTFDSCSAFAQRHVDFVLSDVVLNQKCVSLSKKITQGPSVFWVYKIRTRNDSE